MHRLPEQKSRELPTLIAGQSRTQRLVWFGLILRDDDGDGGNGGNGRSVVGDGGKGRSSGSDLSGTRLSSRGRKAKSSFRSRLKKMVSEVVNTAADGEQSAENTQTIHMWAVTLQCEEEQHFLCACALACTHLCRTRP